MNAVLTAAMLALFYLTVPPFLHWALANATWDGLSRKACAPDGACWAFVKARFALFIYGRYPQPERWRVDLAFALLVLLSAGTLFAPRRRGWWLLALLVVMPIAGGVLLIGGVFGSGAGRYRRLGRPDAERGADLRRGGGLVAARHLAGVRAAIDAAAGALGIDRLHRTVARLAAACRAVHWV